MSGRGDILLLRTISHFVLTAMPAFTFASLAAWRGLRNPVLLGLTALAGVALPSYAAFWLWFLSPRTGHGFSFLLPVFGIGLLIWVYPKLEVPARRALGHLLIPTALVFFASLLVLSAGFLYSGLEHPLSTPWRRYSHPLPPDNIMPYRLAEQVRIAKIAKPFMGDWHSSDRPPLQTAIALAQYPFIRRHRELGYTVLGAILQSLWIYAMWLLLVAFDLPRPLILVALLTTLLSGFTFLNSFFVWPKLLAATFMIGFSTVLLVDTLFDQLRHNVPLMILAGALLSFGMLAHGGSVFPFVGGLIAAFAIHRRLPLKSLGIIFLTAFLIYLPWLLYQKFYDPPGDYLLKLHLSAVEHPNDRSVFETVVTSYRALTLREFIQTKQTNLVWIFDFQQQYWKNVLHLFSALLRGSATDCAVAADHLRTFSFFHFIPNLGFLSFGIIALLAGLQKSFRSQSWRVAARLWLFIICTLVPWWLVMFKPGSTAIHQGTYVTVVVAFSASILALWAVAPWLALSVAMLQIALNFLIYGVYLRVPEQNSAPVIGTLQSGELVLFALALVSIFVVLRSQWSDN